MILFVSVVSVYSQSEEELTPNAFPEERTNMPYSDSNQYENGDEDLIEYDISTKSEIVIKKRNGEFETHQIILRTPENLGSEAKLVGILESNLGSVEYFNKLIIQDGKLLMQVSTGKVEINVLPDEAKSISELVMIDSLALKEEGENAIYVIEGKKDANVLGIFTVSMNVNTKIDAENRDIISVKKPWWGILTR